MMGQLHNSKNETAARRFVLADKFAPKANHKVESTESSAFGGSTPAMRQDNPKTVAKPDVDLQDSIKSILADFK